MIWRTVSLETNYWEIYPRHEDMTLMAMERPRDGLGVQLTLGSDMPAFSHFLYSINNAAWQKSESHAIPIRFDDNHKPWTQDATATIKAVSTTGSESKPRAISLTYFPKEFYAAHGQTSPGDIMVKKSDLALTATRVEDWIVIRPAPDDVAFAKKTWGALFSADRPDYENARALARSIVDDLAPHGGVPSDEMGGLSPFDQYRRVVAGKDHVWCTNFAAIFAHAANALGVPCRIVGLGRPATAPPNGEGSPNLVLAQGHQTNEIYSEDLQGWVWMDLTHGTLGAYLGDEGPIGTMELYTHLNDPNRAPGLRLHLYDVESRTANTVSLSQIPQSVREGLLNYYKRDQRFHFTRWGWDPP